MTRNWPGFYRRLVLATCFITAICCKLTLQYYFFDFNGDETLQATVTQSLADGNGLRLPLVYGRNLSQLVYVPLLAWPPGYSFILLPFYWLTHDLIWSTLLVDFTATVLFFIIYRALLCKLRLPFFDTCLLLLFNGVFLAPDVVSSAPTDLLALAFLMLALYYFVLISEREVVRKTAGFLLSVLCFLPVLFRYLYLPVAFVLPPLLYWLGWFAKNKRRLHAGAIALAGTALYCVALLYFLKANTGVTGNNPTLDAAGFGLHFSNLTYLHPFLFSAFVNLNFVAQQLSLLTGYSYEAIMHFTRQLHYGILFFAGVASIRFLFKKAWFQNQNRDRVFFAGGLLISFFTVSFLCFLSATTALVMNADRQTLWTYVQEGRYYKFIAFFLPIGAFYYLNTPPFRLPVIKTVLRYGLYFLLIFETLHGGYFIARRVVPSKAAQRQVAFEQTYSPFLNPFLTASAKDGNDVILAGALNPYFWRARGYAIKPLLYTQQLNQPLYATKPVVLLVALHETMLPQFKPFLSKSGVTQEWKKNRLYFFSLHLAAHEQK